MAVSAVSDEVFSPITMLPPNRGAPPIPRSIGREDPVEDGEGSVGHDPGLDQCRRFHLILDQGGWLDQACSLA